MDACDRRNNIFPQTKYAREKGKCQQESSRSGQVTLPLKCKKLYYHEF